MREVAKKSSWKWVGHGHISILALASYLQAYKRAARLGGGRFSFLLDSSISLFVCKGQKLLPCTGTTSRKIMAIAIAFGVFASNHFCPTRLNVSDDPTRSVDLRGPVAHGPVYQSLDFDGVFRLAELPKLKRWAANWVILVLGLSGPRTFIPPVLKSLEWRCRQRSLPISLHQAVLDFDATLGFPGEGPGQVRFVWIWIVWCFSIGAPRGFWTLVAGAPSNGLAPRHAEDLARVERRKHVSLEFTRPVQPITKTNRQGLLSQFAEWLRGKGSSLQKVLDEAFTNPEKLCKCLAEYGKELYEAGGPYSHYSETINAVDSERPSARRLLTGAWDVAFSWLREEPFEHHIACPFQVLLALCAVCMCWGWIEVAGLLDLSWGGICRIGEVLAAYRRDHILPSDVMRTSASVLLRVQEPKTRFRAARHQVAKVEYETWSR